MLLTLLKSKIHCAIVTEANLHYMGSITIDQDLMDASGIIAGEQVRGQQHEWRTRGYLRHSWSARFGLHLLEWCGCPHVPGGRRGHHHVICPDGAGRSQGLPSTGHLPRGRSQQAWLTSRPATRQHLLEIPPK